MVKILQLMGTPRFLQYLPSNKLSPCVQILRTYSSSHVKGERSSPLLFSRKKQRGGPLTCKEFKIHTWHAIVGCFFPGFVQLHSDLRLPFLVHLKYKRINEDHASHDQIFEFQLQSDAWSLCNNAVLSFGLLFFPVDPFYGECLSR